MMVTTVDLLQKRWKLVENAEDADKLLEQIEEEEKQQKEGTSGGQEEQWKDKDEEMAFRRAVVRSKCQIVAGRIGDQHQLKAKLDELFPDRASDDEAVQHIVHHLSALFHLLVDTNLDKARDNIRKAMAFAETDVEDTILSARILAAKGQRQLASTQLVNAAKQDAFNWALLYWLADCLAASGALDKARQCLDRARQLNPASELCARLMEHLFIKMNASHSDSARLDSLIALLQHRPNSQWALRQAAILEINAGRLEQAVDKCQRVIRLIINVHGDRPELMDARQCLVAMWIFIAEAYRKQGNLQSAVRACKAVLEELEPENWTAKLQLLQLNQEMCRLKEAIALGNQLEQQGNLPVHLLPHLRTLHLLSLVRFLSDPEEMNRSNFVLVQMELLPEVFRRAKELLIQTNEDHMNGDKGKTDGDSSASVLIHKCIAEAFKIVLNFNECHLAQCLANTGLSKSVEEGGWKIGSRWDLLKARIHSLIKVLKANGKVGDSWNELGMTFFDAHLFAIKMRRKEGTGKEEDCTKGTVAGDDNLDSAIKCFQSAIRVSADSPLKCAEFYCQMGKAWIVRGNAPRAQHCFIRAIQLDKHSHNAWILLALLYLQLGLNDEGLGAMNNAQKIRPALSEAWCAHAIHADRGNHFDAMDLFRHAIVLKPSALAMQNYCHHLMECQRNKHQLDEGTMINFEVLKNLYYMEDLNAPFVHALACLAEHFWYLEEAREYICGSKSTAESKEPCLARNRERILIKTGQSKMSGDELAEKFPGSGLKALKMLYAESTEALFERLLQLSPFSELFSAISANNPVLFAYHYQPTLFPILATAAILFGLKFSDELLSVVESVRPLHKLVDVFPLQHSKMDKPLLAPYEENEEVLVRHDHLSDRLYGLLKQRLAELDSTEGAKESENIDE